MSNMRWDAIWINGLIATCEDSEMSYGLIPKGAIAVKNNKIAWVGKMNDLPGKPKELAIIIYDINGQCITPGLIDCHTHLVYGGNRCSEFEMRLQGASYQDIAKAGGGILSTVKATREASEEELLSQVLPRIRALLAEGVTTIEIKSGYGLDLASELKVLRAIKNIADLFPVNIVSTFLGAHALPPEFNNADNYIDYVCEEMLPAIAKENLASIVDVFCEIVGFTLQQTEKVFAAAKKYKLDIKCHAEQLSNSGGAKLASQYKALSADHLEYLSEEGVLGLAKSQTVAVLLPGAYYFLREKQLPPVDLLRKYKVPIAIATDSNPGTSPVTSLLLMLNMACVLFQLTPEEALLGVTRWAAKALGLEKTHGTLKEGKSADFVVWDIRHPSELCYFIGMNRCSQIVRGGRQLS